MLPRIRVPDDWAELWSGDAATHPLRTFVVLLAPDGGDVAPRGTVVAPTQAAARTVAR